MNVPAVITAFRLIVQPSLILPHQVYPTFAQLPVPLSKAFAHLQRDEKPVDIRAIVLDKDNCFATPETNEIHPSCKSKFDELLRTYSPSKILIVSNSSGLKSKDPEGLAADSLERTTGVKVLRHSKAKPACKDEIMAHFGGEITSPAQIAVIGDRLFTDIVMANLMGSYSIWIREGVRPDTGRITRLEYGIHRFLTRRNWRAPTP